MTLLSQWCDELERSSKQKGGLRVLMYYGAGRSSAKGLQEEIDSGVDVVVTRCADSTGRSCGVEYAAIDFRESLVTESCARISKRAVSRQKTSRTQRRRRKKKTREKVKRPRKAMSSQKRKEVSTNRERKRRSPVGSLRSNGSASVSPAVRERKFQTHDLTDSI